MGKLNVDAMQAKLDNVSKSSGGGGGFDSLGSGKNTRRILWPKGDKEEFWSEGFVHFSLGAEGKTMVTCPKTFNAKNPCPVCEEIEKLKKGSKEDKALANKIRQVRRIYVNVINRDDEEGSNEPKILPIGVTVLKGLLEIICDPDYGDITDFDEGRDVTIKKSGTGLNTEYSVLAKPKSTPASEQYDEDTLEEKMADLDGVFKEQSYDELSAILNGEDYDEDDDEDDDEDSNDEAYEEWDLSDLQDECMARGIKFTKAQAKSKIKLAALLEADDEAGDDEDGEEDENDDEPPFEEDDSEDGEESEEYDDDDDDDEEEKPVKKPSAKASKSSTKQKAGGKSSSRDDVRDSIKAALNRRKKK